MSSNRDAFGLLLGFMPQSTRAGERLAWCEVLFPPSPILCSQMTTLEVVESPESMAAVAYLLNLVLKR